MPGPRRHRRGIRRRSAGRRWPRGARRTCRRGPCAVACAAADHRNAERPGRHLQEPQPDARADGPTHQLPARQPGDLGLATRPKDRAGHGALDEALVTRAHGFGYPAGWARGYAGPGGHDDAPGVARGRSGRSPGAARAGLGPWPRPRPVKLVRPPPVDRLERLDQAPPLEPSQRPVERARAHRRSGDRLDVGHDRVAVLRSVAQRHAGCTGTVRRTARARTRRRSSPRSSVACRSSSSRHDHAAQRPVGRCCRSGWSPGCPRSRG